MALKPLNSVAGFSVGENPANIILANGDVTANALSVSGKSNLNSIGNVYISGGSNNQVIQTDGAGNLSFVTIDTWQIQNGNSNVQVLANGNVTISVTGNANVATFTSTGVNVSGYLSASNITANGNVSANNYVITPGSTDLIIAPGGSYTRIYANLNPYTDTTYDLGNSLARWNNVFSNTANVTGNIKAGGLLTDNLYYANGTPWDLQEAAGSNTQIQYNDGNTNFGASANFTYNDSTQLLTVLGNIQSNNANLGNLATANYINVSSNVVSNNITVNLELSGNTANFTGNISAGSANLGNLATANFVNVSSNLQVTDTANVGNLRTDNLLYANGQPWDLQEAAGANTQIQYNDGSNNFGASANLTYNDATQLFTVNGNSQFNNANLGNLATANYANVANAVFASNIVQNASSYDTRISLSSSTGIIEANTDGNTTQFLPGGTVRLSASGTGQIVSGTFDGSGITLGGSQTDLFQNRGGNVTVQVGANGTISNTWTFNQGGNLVSPGALLTLGNQQYDIGSSSNQWANVYAANFIGNVSGNISAPGANTEVIFNDANVTNAVANFTYDKSYNSGGGELNVGNTNGGRIITDDFYSAYANINGNVDISGNVSVTQDITANNITANSNISITGSGGDITMTGGNITGVNNISANSANFAGNVISNNFTVNLDLSGNTANFTGNISAGNANLGNFAVANYVNVNNDLNVLGNINAGNLVGTLANGTSNIRIFQDANIELSVANTANVVTVTSTGLYVVGEINTTAGNMLSNGNVTANGFLNGANANVTGEVAADSVLTANITAPSGNITISAAGVDQNIVFNPTGNGTVDVGLHKVTQVGDPTNPHDAATKEYVDNIAQGISVHQAVNVTSATNLNATYLDGGTALTTTTISGGKTIQFSTNHGLSIGDEIYWTSSFNGIIAYDSYFVYSTPALNQITVKNGFYGAEVTTLTNGTGLTQPSLANSGVGATLTNAGANVAIQIDGISLSSTNRVLVQGQTNAYENGVYVVTTVGNGSTRWVLTRSSDTNTYDPKSSTGLAVGDYFFVEQGSGYAGSSYVLSSPTGEIIFGYTNLGFTQFSAGGSYTAGNGIAITGTTISANVDGVTTDIVAGNIVVKAGANLTTPNLGDATFSSLTWNTLSNGNVSANNLSISNVANITVDLTVGGNIQANGTISSNANVSGLNFTTNGNVQAGGNILANNITANYEFSTTNANISTNLITSNATVNLELTGNTANFSGNIVVSSATVNLELSGNTANFSGNVIVPNLTVNTNIAGNTANFTGTISAANANLGNLVTANYFTGTLVNGNSNAFIDGANGNFNISVGGTANVLQITSGNANITGNLNVSGNFNVNDLVSNTLTANTAVYIGNTTITWDTVTTTSVTANQTIASLSVTGITGLEFLVKAIDAGGKYSVATVQAVTDGTNVDYATFGTVQLGGYTGSLAVNVVGGYIRLQVTPSSSNSTLWTTQARTI